MRAEGTKDGRQGQETHEVGQGRKKGTVEHMTERTDEKLKYDHGEGRNLNVMPG